ncbi:hypothetical protein PoB_001231700 [Plakobranchus ocellatus]|uniref:Uncharacterized protein n=1 Tax=Plakobranchus ocellatus TaxID=259542 RepID=A0AAV3YTL6_9GAST|nr:hypothetical protein PoB_001231700 [Plakobranchus ocellatus]
MSSNVIERPSPVPPQSSATSTSAAPRLSATINQPLCNRRAAHHPHLQQHRLNCWLAHQPLLHQHRNSQAQGLLYFQSAQCQVKSYPKASTRKENSKGRKRGKLHRHLEL